MSIAKPSQIQGEQVGGRLLSTPNDHVLEIGIGAAILARARTERQVGLLKGMTFLNQWCDGHKRNQDNVAAGKIRLVRSDFLKPDKKEACYDKVVSFILISIGISGISF